MISLKLCALAPTVTGCVLHLDHQSKFGYVALFFYLYFIKNFDGFLIHYSYVGVIVLS